MFNNLGIVKEAISNNELKVLSINRKEEFILKASNEYVSSIKSELNDEEGETIIVEFDLKNKIINENIF
ncbi:hypothetical protein [uncultured Clostridium sp.]|uniref:hypothetical protein n=1 Tax=uncultured Clostridium sp. TaxID=59620 RepID=UPI0025F19B58|nr:hypothetical protein [uncultured Clostridium sp.]